MKSNKTRILLIIIVSTLFSALLISFYFFSFNFVISQILDRGNSDTENINALINEYNSIEEGIDSFSSNRDLEIIVVDENYRVLKSNAKTLRTQYFSNNITSAKTQGTAYSFIRRDVGQTFSLIYSKKGKFNNNVIVTSIEYPFLLYSDFRRTIITLIIVTLLILALDTYLITNIIINTYINDLNNFLTNRHLYNEFSESDYKLFVEDGNSEVLNLLKTLNTFKTRYDSILDNNKKKFSKFNSLISIIPSGIMIIDNNKEISLINESANKILNLHKREILFPRKIKQLNKLNEIWEQVTSKKIKIVEDISINHKIIEIEAIALNDKYSPFEFLGVLFLLRDVTKSRELIKMKDEFVSNVSHEIRTPLTIISGFSQALMSQNISDDDKKICVDSIDVEVKKMTKLVEELLQISRLEKNKQKRENQTFNPFVVVKEQISSFISKANEKEIKIQLELTEDKECELTSNLIYFRQIINNLIDNAIKYSNRNTSITIREYIDDIHYYFEIEDEGFGIDKDSLTHIFERFYRVEKSRNSEIGGSGLGLSLVKMFVESMNGEISVDSIENKGTIFTVQLNRGKYEK